MSIDRVGLVTSLGSSAPATCAALRAGISNASVGPFTDRTGNPLAVHRVALERPWYGRGKLLMMCTAALTECLQGLPPEERTGLALILCTAEPGRVGRIEGIDKTLLDDIARSLDGAVDRRRSLLLPGGRPGALLALRHARGLLQQGAANVLIAAVDSLLTVKTIDALLGEDRLLTRTNSNGFIPGEGAGAMLVSRATRTGGLVCSGLGAGMEPAHLTSGKPLRAEGLSAAIRAALDEAGREIHEIDFRIADLSGEQFYFKEASMAVARLLRQRKATFDLWHPAEGIGETGALATIAMVAVAWYASRKGYGPGPRMLLHAGSDGSERIAAIFESQAVH
jgi:3-oxoacyl-[acyl-carrier-protein] synthase-1